MKSGRARVRSYDGTGFSEVATLPMPTDRTCEDAQYGAHGHDVSRFLRPCRLAPRPSNAPTSGVPRDCRDLRAIPVFEDFTAGCAAARSFTDKTLLGDAKLMAWVLMPDHAHWLLQLGERDTFAKVVGRMKACSAREVNRTTARGGPLWERAYHDHAMRKDQDLASIARYIVANPLRADLVTNVRNYPFWDAIWL